MIDIEDSIKALIISLHKHESTQFIIVIEECSELIKECTKTMRGYDHKQSIIDEACDVICTAYTLLKLYNITETEIEEHIRNKVNRSILRYKEDGLL